ncbi:hypothetical protein [Halalkalicoccus salilacus]|uniref:hypothetical protein n=1 Tax=Halalkalicoccus salilacus TaxID=3117459 RepID=UPI002F960F54
MFEDDELTGIVEGCHDRRHWVCPKCGRPEAEIEEGKIEAVRGTEDGSSLGREASCEPPKRGSLPSFAHGRKVVVRTARGGEATSRE